MSAEQGQRATSSICGTAEAKNTTTSSKMTIFRGLQSSYGRFVTSKAVTAKSLSGQAQHTLAFQEKLAKLPLPELEQTVSKWLVTTKPHLTAQEFEKTKSLASAFLTEAQPMQNYLKDKATNHHNWFADWWLDMAYLGYRSPLPIWSSPGLVLPPQDFANSETKWLAFASKFIHGALDYKTMLDEGTVPVEMSGKQPMDMIQYYRLFGATRIPGATTDGQRVTGNSDYCIVAHNGHFFKLPLYGKDRNTATKADIFGGLAKILEESKRLQVGGRVGVLTADTRDNWFKAYEKLLSIGNSLAIETIENALFLVCLDDSVNSNEDALTKTGLNSLHGLGAGVNGCNRWYDKALQFIIAKSGEVAVSNEHSFAEAVPTMAIADHILDCINNNNVNNSTASAVQGAIEHIPFILDNEVEALIDNSSKHLAKEVSDLELKMLDFQHFGKEFIKSQRFSPDSFVQMAIQLSFFKMHNSPGATYESGATRVFKDGRTEVIRSCTAESTEFSRMMLDKGATVEAKRNALTNAIMAHNQYARMAVQGMGVDRHLQGLKMAAVEMGQPLPQLYSDCGYTRSSRMRLSTSQISSKHNSFCCYGPLEMDGYGCSYSLGSNILRFGISAMRSNNETSANEFKESLSSSLIDLHDLCLAKPKL